MLDEKIKKLWEIEEEGIIQECLVELSVEDRKVIKLWDTECKILYDHFHDHGTIQMLLCLTI